MLSCVSEMCWRALSCYFQLFSNCDLLSLLKRLMSVLMLGLYI